MRWVATQIWLAENLTGNGHYAVGSGGLRNLRRDAAAGVPDHQISFEGWRTRNPVWRTMLLV